MAEEKKSKDIEDYPPAEIQAVRDVAADIEDRRLRELFASGGDIAAYMRARVLDRLGGADYVANLINANSDNPRVVCKLLEIFMGGNAGTPRNTQNNTQINVDVRGALQGILDEVSKPNA